MKPIYDGNPEFGHRLAAEMTREALSMREDTLDMRLRLWLMRLKEQRGIGSPKMALERALDAALSVTHAASADLQLMDGTRYGLQTAAQRGFDIDGTDAMSALVVGHDGHFLGVLSVHVQEHRSRIESDLMRLKTLADFIAVYVEEEPVLGI
jgi:hypothetical protein